MGGGVSALILSQQTGCMLRGGGGEVSLDTFTEKGCKEGGAQGGGGRGGVSVLIRGYL